MATRHRVEGTVGATGWASRRNRRLGSLRLLHSATSPTPCHHHRRRQLDAGQLVCAGATGSPPDGALFVFKGLSNDEIEAFVKVTPAIPPPPSLSCRAGILWPQGCAPPLWPPHAVTQTHKHTNTHAHTHRRRRHHHLNHIHNTTHTYTSQHNTMRVQADPYYQNGLVTAYKISPYAVVVGQP